MYFGQYDEFNSKSIRTVDFSLTFKLDKGIFEERYKAYNMSDKSCAYLNIRGCCIVDGCIVIRALRHLLRLSEYLACGTNNGVLVYCAEITRYTGSLKCTTCRGSRVARRPTESLWISDF